MKKNMRDIKRKLRKARAAEVYEDGRSVRKGEKLTLPELTTAPAFPEWRRKFRDAVKEAAGRHYDEAWRWILELERPDIQLEDLADSGRFPLLDNAISAAITRAAAKVTVGFDIGQKEEELRKQEPPSYLKGRQKALMVYRSFRTDEARGFQFGYEDLLTLRCAGDGDLERFHKAFKAVRVKLPHDMDPTLIRLMYYDQVKGLSQLRETIYHYENADEGSETKSLVTLTSAVEKILDRKQRDTNRRAQTKAGAVPGMTAEPRPKRRTRSERRKKKKDEPSDTASNAGSEASSTSRSTTSSAVSCPAVHDECKTKGLCYRFQRGTCTKGDKCRYKHERCTTPLPDGWRKGSRGRGRGGRGGGRGNRERSASPGKPDPRTAEEKAKVECRHHKRGSCRLGDKCPYKH